MRSTTADTRELAANVRLTIGRVARRLRQETGGDLTPTGLSILATLDRLGALTMRDLAAAERVQPPTITRAVGRLEEIGLVARTTDGADRRISRVTLSEEGRRQLTQSRTRKDVYLAARLAALREEEIVVLRRALPVLERLVGEG